MHYSSFVYKKDVHFFIVPQLIDPSAPEILISIVKGKMSVCKSYSFTLSILLQLACCALVHCTEAQSSRSDSEEPHRLTADRSSSGPSFSDDSARSASGDNVKSSDGLSSGSTDGQCLRNTITSGASSNSYYEMNWPLVLFLFMVFLFVLVAVNIKYCINCVGYTFGFIAYCLIAAADLADNDSNIFYNYYNDYVMTN